MSRPFQARSSDDILAKLNERQQEAVTTTEGYVRVIAGAGSGKTRALTHRFAYLVNMGISPSDILCVTFTNKAAAEMKKRIRRMIGDFGSGRISTFHGFCVHLLREDCHVLQYPPNFPILDDEDAKGILRACFEKLGISSKQISSRKAKETVDSFKRKYKREYCELLIDPRGTALSELRQSAKTLEDKIVYEYLHEQRKIFGLDFTDLIVFTLYVLNADENIRIKWQKRLQYVMVDEFQDVDNDQYELAKILSDYYKNLFVVGDPDQTIYTWRGATVGAILNFDRVFPDAKTIVMDVNYRSLVRIINASNSLIRKNKARIEKNLIPHRKDDGFAKYFHASTQKEEAEWIARQIEALKGYGVILSNIAVLYRAHYVGRPIEEALRGKHLPYTVYNGVAFYNRKEIKDALSYLRLIFNGDDLSFLRVVNEPRRGIGKKRIEFLINYAETHRCSYLSALSGNVDSSQFQATGAGAFVELVNKYKKTFKNYTLTDLLDAVLNESGYEEHLRASGDEDRLENLAELKQSICEYENASGGEANLESYLQDIALYAEKERDDDAESVKLMTIHSAKGLEFPCVFVCGMSEGVFPSQKAFAAEKLEEERRLAYVAFTRAGDMLMLSDSEGFNFDGSFRSPSRFIFDAEQVNLEYEVPLRRELIEATERVAAGRYQHIDSHLAFAVGSRIFHPTFGNGVVQSINEQKSCYVIVFDEIAVPREIRFNAPLKENQ